MSINNNQEQYLINKHDGTPYYECLLWRDECIHA